MVILHDFLDHLDGIVAKAQKQTYGSVDDPLLGGFMDAFCDKVSAALYLGMVYVFEQQSTLKCSTLVKQ
jgi:phosphatidylglycerophosphate synthase